MIGTRARNAFVEAEMGSTVQEGPQGRGNERGRQDPNETDVVE